MVCGAISSHDAKNSEPRWLSALSQTLRSVPDNLERTLGLSPDIAQEVGRQIDAALDDMATRFEELTVQAIEVENGSDLV